ncbi:MAG: hypothetical protein ACR2KJ_03565 [Jatrophihabitans sp.]
MIGWIALGVALLVAIVVLGFCAYELRWKTARLRSDLERMRTLSGELSSVLGQLTAAQSKLTAARTSESD